MLKSSSFSTAVAKSATMVLFFASLFFLSQYYALVSWHPGSYDNWLYWSGIALLGLNIGYYIFAGILAYCFYKPVPALPDAELPTCTVIVPAYNEGAGVLNSLNSILASDFPAEKMEVLAIDDGSVDDTWEWIERAAQKSNGRITAIKLEKNGGKRHAMYMGIRRSTSEVIVTVDSDSVVPPESLRNICSPFKKSDIGGVAGFLRVKNLDGLLPRMMDVSFVFGADYIRAAQSVMGSVLCTPGALSAYRRESLLPFLDEWLEQKFMGEPARIAEDRALTSYLLAHDMRVVMQRNAVAETIIPDHYRNTCKMLLRWGRGDVRESMHLYPAAFHKLDGFHLGLQLNLAMQLMALLMPLISVPFLLAGLVAMPLLCLTSIILGTVAWSSIPAFIYWKRCGGSSDAVLAYTFSIFKMIFLLWVDIWCIFSVRNSGWMTRMKPARVRNIVR